MDVLSKEIKESMSVVSELAAKLPNRVNMIKKELDLCFQEKLDIEHKIEIENANAYEGWRLYRDLQITLRKRRELKDELSVLEDIFATFTKKDIFTSHTRGASMSIKNSEETLEARTYSVKVRKDLVNSKNRIVVR